MGLQCGIVGLPNVGKSTLFNALTKAGIAAENYPFCTIEPNVGVVEVPDARLESLAGIVKPARVVPATVEFVDIAGLVSGASQGEGLGNQFLANIRETDAIVQVVRCFDDDNVVHVAGRVDPLADVGVIETELGLADLATVEKGLARALKAARVGDKEALRLQALLERVQAGLNDGRPVRALGLSGEELRLLAPLCLLTLKPVLYVANVSEHGFADNPRLEALRERAAAEGAGVVAVSAALEADMAGLPDEDKRHLLDELGLDEPGLDRLADAAYRLLGLLTFFTAGPKEARAWTIRAGETAPRAAGAIHSDFEKGFIRAEVIAYEDYVAQGGEAGARDSGRLRLEGRDYVVRDGDVMHFRFNV